ncbi:MAG: vanadium-dependent haloperoxidase [Ferruginibacter sp.]|nr:vanadium-dependent haloperoxidase [Ferruginibacter sp.]
MKKIPQKMNGLLFAPMFITLTVIALVFGSCKKYDDPVPPGNDSYSADVLDKWMSMQIRLMRNATGIPNQAFSRHFAYAGVAAFESFRPGLKAHNSLSVAWNGLTGLPQAGNWKNYYSPANVNAALATINRSMFPGASATDKAAIDSLEMALRQVFLTKATAAIINNSENFGKTVATAVFNWAETDGYKNASAPYTLPAGAGIWKPTPPAFAAPSTPYWGNNRIIITGSLNNTAVNSLPVYSTDPASTFYKMVKQVYDASLTLTDDQKAMALFWRDVPGVTSPGHWVSIVQQIIKSKNAKLDKAILAYALTGAALNDVLIRSFQIKYQSLTVRPITYIKEVMGYSDWTSFIGTPAHPEYLSNHSSLSVAAAGVLEELFGKNQFFTDHTYDYMGMAPRTYPSYMAIGLEAGISRLYGGIHYIPSIDAGTQLGKKVVQNIFLKN